MPSIAYEIIDLLAAILRLIGMVVLGLGIGWLAIDLLKKMQVWQVQVAVFLGLAGLIIAIVVFTGMGAQGAFAIGVGVAILLWGMPKKQKKDEEKK